MKRNTIANPPHWTMVVHPGPDPDRSGEYLRDIWVKAALDKVDAMHLSASQLTELRYKLRVKEDNREK